MEKFGYRDHKTKKIKEYWSSMSKNSNKHIVLLLGFCVLVLVVLLLVIFKIHADNKNKLSDICTQESNVGILRTAAAQISEDKVSALGKSVHTIQQLPNYQKDPNCLYTIVNYYINYGNMNQASYYLHELKSVYNPSVGYSRVFGNSTKNPSALATEISFETSFLKTLQQNENALSSP